MLKPGQPALHEKGIRDPMRSQCTPYGGDYVIKLHGRAGFLATTGILLMNQVYDF